MPAGATTDTPGPAAGDPVTAAERAEAAAREFVGHLAHAIRGVVHIARGLMFGVYLLLLVLSFWIWVAMLLVGVLLLVVRGVMLLFLWLSDGMAPREPAASVPDAIRRDLRTLWGRRMAAYEAFARPAARYYLRAHRGWLTFWHWPLHRKAFAVAFAFAFIFVPAMYIVPRPHYVQITDDNAIHYRDGRPVIYLVHGLDMFEPGVHREYANEDAWWLGKINSQGLKSQLQVGKYYRLWVVGLRWYYMPQLFPNIIAATEVDEKGETIEHPTARVAVPPGAAVQQ